MIVKDKMALLQMGIFVHDYYVELYLSCLIQRGMYISGIIRKEYSDEEIWNVCDDFWVALPDSPEIRRDPFFDLCDICQLCFEESDV